MHCTHVSKKKNYLVAELHMNVVIHWGWTPEREGRGEIKRQRGWGRVSGDNVNSSTLSSVSWNPEPDTEAQTEALNFTKTLRKHGVWMWSSHFAEGKESSKTRRCRNAVNFSCELALWRGSFLLLLETGLQDILSLGAESPTWVSTRYLISTLTLCDRGGYEFNTDLLFTQ